MLEELPQPARHCQAQLPKGTGGGTVVFERMALALVCERLKAR